MSINELLQQTAKAKTDLHNERSVLNVALKHLLTVLSTLGEQAAVEHGRITAVGSERPAQHPECQLRLVHLQQKMNNSIHIVSKW